MRSRWLLAIPCFVPLLTLTVHESSATLYCNRAYSQLGMNPGRPYSAVGFLNNGCTAVLIGENHIAAAGHCFVDGNGAWQKNLRFYPNFHPNRVTADPKRVPRGDVLHVVVGSRAGGSALGDGSDWGIARIGNWRDTDGLDMSPLRLARSMPAPGSALVNPAYTRHHFPYDDNDPPAWDDMEWDNTNCGWVGSNKGMWAMRMRTAPLYDGTNRDMVGCNSRWMAGTIHADCTLTRVTNDVVVHNCDTVGGSSGSPILYKQPRSRLPVRGQPGWVVIGIGHGGGPADFSQLVPTCTEDAPARRDNVGPSVARFRLAPRFASNVAVHRRPDKPSATAVFAVDSDMNQVVYRAREGSSPTYTDRFSFWTSLGTPVPGAKLSKIAACAVTGTRPQVFVIGQRNTIYTRFAAADGSWSSWSSFGIPSGTMGVADIDASTDSRGRCMLFMVADGGAAYARAKTSDTAWGSWSRVANGTYEAITALRYHGALVAVMIDTSGKIWQILHSGSQWTSPADLGRPGGVTAWRDIDMTWDEHARAFLLAIPENGGNKLFFMPAYGDKPWSQWRYFDTHLWTPGAKPTDPPRDAPNLRTLTASRWMEDPSGTTSPVIFATDDYGNIYFLEYARVGTPGWNLDWKSFYHETIVYK